MRAVKNILSIILAFCMLLPLFPMTGCSKFKEAMEQQRIKQSEEDALRIDKANDVRYRMFFEGFGLYYGPHSEFIAENVGLAKLYIGRLDDNGDVTGLPCTELNGIYHPGREQVEKIISAVLNESSTINDIESVMSPDLLNSAGKEELEAFYEFARLDPKRKKNAIFFFIGEQDGGYVVSSVVYTDLGHRCISLLIKEDMLSGAKLSDDEDMKKPVINRIKGFEL